MKRILLIVLLFLAACTTSSNTNGGSNTNWRSGSQGLVMNFAPDAPPSEVINDQEFNVILEVQNQGATDLNSVQFYLTGFDPSVLHQGAYDGPDFPLEGKSAFNPDGSYTDFASWEFSVNSPPNVDSFQQDVTATACYAYETIANPEICIDPQKYEYTASSRCNFDVRNLGGSQGGPIAVTSIRQKTTDTKVLLEIEIQNKGSGTVFPSSQVNNCHTDLEFRDINTVDSITVSSGTSGSSFSCRPSNPIRLHDGRGIVVCESGISGQSYYVTPLVITLRYGYRQTTSRSLTVVNID